jgi:Methyltransferase small domain
VATTTDEFGDFYNARLAASDLKRYREKGPRPWTRALVESLKAEGVEGATLLDIGGGVGVISHELLAAGASSATCVDASAAYLASARAGRLYGLVYPRDTPFVRLVIVGINVVLRLRRKQVRAAIPPTDAIERVLREKGLSLHVSKSVGPAWQVAVYRRA